jgi:tyrosyl-tRNA synthetase
MRTGGKLDRLLRRGVSEIIVESEFVELLDSGRPLRLKMGFDPSAPDIHVGHAVGLRKLRQLQELGHKVVLIVGDWTAQIGDPSGKSQTRPMLTQEEVLENAETYLAQFFKVVERDRTEVRWQSEWFGPFSLRDVIGLTSRFTVAQFLAREDFAKRYEAQQPIAITELLYPLLQAYDSVAIESDVEFGGTDQKFNLLVGRDLQGMMGHRPQQCLLVPLLPGTDGVQKMSKSLGNYIGIDEPPNEIFGKTMSLPDHMIVPYLENVTDVSDEELADVRRSLDGASANPMDAKKLLATELVRQFQDDRAAEEARLYFERTVQGGETPDDMSEYIVASPADLQGRRISRILVDAELVESASEARRLVSQGAVRVNDDRVDGDAVIDLSDGDVIRVGRRRYTRIVVDQN